MILIKNARLFTGDYNDKAVEKNILINAEGRIEKISTTDIPATKETRIIDAQGKWATPGFVDSHTHYDVELIASPGLKESARHGVTTIILGSCSVSTVYNNPEDTTDSFARVEAIPEEVVLPLLQREKRWNNAKEWRAYVEELPLGVNIASFIGHSDIRMKAMGIERSTKDNTEATKEEKKIMEDLLHEALDEGFLGLSTMDSPWDKMSGDRYWSHKTPSFYASWKERKNLINILRKREAVLQGAPNLVNRISAVNYMMASTGLFRKPLKTTMIAMMDLIGDRMVLPLVSLGSRVFNVLGRGNFRMQSPPCPFTVYYDGVDSIMFEEFPSGEALRHLAKEIDTRNDLIRDIAFRKQFKREMKNRFAPRVWHKDLSRSVILKSPDVSMVGKNFYQLAEERGEHPIDTFLDLIIQYDKEITWTTTIANDRIEKYNQLYNFPYNIISFSDAGAHLTNMAFYNFPLKMIKNVQESIKKGNPIMSMEKCIWRLTKEQTDWFEMDRGYIAEGKLADIVIIDPSKLDRVTEEVNDAVIEEFDNYRRLVNRNEGVVTQVLVNGKLIFENEAFVEGYGKTKKFGRFTPKMTVNA